MNEEPVSCIIELKQFLSFIGRLRIPFAQSLLRPARLASFLCRAQMSVFAGVAELEEVAGYGFLICCFHEDPLLMFY